MDIADEVFRLNSGTVAALSNGRLVIQSCAAIHSELFVLNLAFVLRLDSKVQTVC